MSQTAGPVKDAKWRGPARLACAALALLAAAAAPRSLADADTMMAAQRLELLADLPDRVPALWHRTKQIQYVASAGRTSDRAGYTAAAGDRTVSWTAATGRLAAVAPVNASSNLGITLGRTTGAQTDNDGLIAVKRSTRMESLEAGPVGTFKIMDLLVLGADLRVRRLTMTGDDGEADTLTHPASAHGLVIKSERWDLGWAQELWTYRRAEAGVTRQRLFRSSVVHGRWLAGPALALGVLARRNPLPACCLAAAEESTVLDARVDWTAETWRLAVMSGMESPGSDAGAGPEGLPRSRLGLDLRHRVTAGIWIGLAALHRWGEGRATRTVPATGAVDGDWTAAGTSLTLDLTVLR